MKRPRKIKPIEPKKLFNVQFHFKGGSTQLVRLHELSSNRDDAGKLTGLSWDPVEGEPRMFHIDVDSVAAIFLEEVK